MKTIDKWRNEKTIAVRMNKKAEKRKSRTLNLLSKYGTFLHGCLCMAITSYLVGLTLIHYLQNNETSVVSPKKFNLTPKDLYPTYTICFVEKITGDILYGQYIGTDGIYQSWYIRKKKGVSWPNFRQKHIKPSTKYRRFLEGNDKMNKAGLQQEIKERQMMSEIDFVKATKPLSIIMETFEFLESFEFESPNHNGQNIRKSKVAMLRGIAENRSSFDSVFYLSQQTPHQLCYTRKSVTTYGYKKDFEKLTF